MKYLIGVFFLVWLAILATNSEILIYEEGPTPLADISSAQYRIGATKTIKINGIGEVAVAKPVNDAAIRRIITLAIQHRCKYFTGRKVIDRRYPKTISPDALPIHSCPNFIWAATNNTKDEGVFSWIEVNNTSSGRDQSSVATIRTQERGGLKSLFPEISKKAADIWRQIEEEIQGWF